jgi:hypothetical protein
MSDRDELTGATPPAGPTSPTRQEQQNSGQSILAALNDPRTWTQERLIEYVRTSTQSWTNDGLEDWSLFEVFIMEFRGWNEDAFRRIGKEAVNLRDYLRRHGVFIQRNAGAVAPILTSLLQQGQPAKWPRADLVREVGLNKATGEMKYDLHQYEQSDQQSTQNSTLNAPIQGTRVQGTSAGPATAVLSANPAIPTNLNIPVFTPDTQYVTSQQCFPPRQQREQSVYSPRRS